MDDQKVLVTIVGMSVVTFLLRYLPLHLLKTRTLPHTMVIWLRFVPAAVICAMLFQWLFVGPTPTTLSDTQKLYMAVSLPVFAIAYTTRNFLGTVLSGTVLTALARLLLAHA